MSITPSTPSLGTLLRDFRKLRSLSLRELAMQLGRPTERVRTLENDDDLPHALEVTVLSYALGTPPHRLLRAIRQTARQMLQDAIDHQAGCPPRAIAARQLKSEAEDAVAETRATTELPVPLYRALAGTLAVPAGDAAALSLAWQALLAKPASSQQVCIEAAAAAIVLEGEDERSDIDV